VAKTSARHTSAEFADFLAQIVASQPAGRRIHVIADNLSAHQTRKVFDFLEANPTVRIHDTPTYANWLNQVEIWFSKIQRAVISRGVFTSVKDLAGCAKRRAENTRCGFRPMSDNMPSSDSNSHDVRKNE
jgi:transposase